MEIKIPYPCLQKWSEMSPTGKGAICFACQKEVIDFRAMSDAEIKYFFQTQTQKICGYFKPAQINPLKKRVAKWWFGALLLLTACQKNELPKSEQKTAKLEEKKGFFDLHEQKKQISGTVRGIHNTSNISGAAVVLLAKQTAIKVITDNTGAFSIKIDADIKEFFLIIKAKEYDIYKRKIKLLQDTSKFDIPIMLMNQYDGLLGEVSGF